MIRASDLDQRLNVDVVSALIELRWDCICSADTIDLRPIYQALIGMPDVELNDLARFCLKLAARSHSLEARVRLPQMVESLSNDRRRELMLTSKGKAPPIA